MEKCIFCDSSCLPENLSSHYTRVHQAGAWANLVFPGTKVYKYLSDCKKHECHICWIGLDRKKDLNFTDIVKHLQKFHKISKQKLPAFQMEKKGQEKEDGHYLDLQSVVTLVKELPQAVESQKRKETESDENLNTKRVKNQQHQPTFRPTLQQPEPTLRPAFQQPQPTLRQAVQQLQPMLRPTFQQPQPTLRSTLQQPQPTLRRILQLPQPTLRPAFQQSQPTLRPILQLPQEMLRPTVQQTQPMFRPTFQQPQPILRSTFQQPRPTFRSTIQQPTPFHRPPPPYLYQSYVRVPHPHYVPGKTRMPRMPPPPSNKSWICTNSYQAPGPRPDHLGPAFYPDPGDDGWRMRR